MLSLRPTRLLLLVVLSTFAAFAPAVANDFAMDDAGLAQSLVDEDPNKPDPVVNGWRAPWWYFGQRYWEGVPNDSILYRPVTILSFALTYNLICKPLFSAGWEAFPHHLANVLLHCFAVYLVWWMGRDLGAGELPAVAVAAMFGLHAIHSEVVAGIVGRAELFSFVFGLWATLVFARGRMLAAGVLYFLAFCSKESALAWAPFLPCYLVARRWSDSREESIGAILRPHGRRMAVVLGASLLVFFVLRHVAIREIDAAGTFSYDQNPLAHADGATRLMTAVRLLGYGLVKCLAPFRLYSLYGPGAVTIVASPADAGFVAALVVLFAWLAAGLWFARLLPLLFLSVAAFLGFSFITSNIPLVIGTVFGERLYYMPSLGVCLLVGLLVARARGRWRAALLVVLGAWTLASVAVIVQRNGAWKDSETLFIGDAERLPESADLLQKAGYMYWLARNDPDKALECFHACVAREPEFAGAWASIARIHLRRGELAEAEKYFKRALDTRFVASSGVEDRTIQDYLSVLLDEKKQAAALRYARAVLERKPAHVAAVITAVDHCGRLLERQSANARGPILDRARRAAPDEPHFVLLAAMLMYESTRPDDAQRNAAVAQRIGWALQHVSIDLFSRETALRSRLYLGDSLAAAGRTREAIGVFEALLADRAVSGDVRGRVRAQLAELRKR